MTTIFSSELNPCRDIIEGRTKLDTLRTVPYVPPAARVLQPKPPGELPARFLGLCRTAPERRTVEKYRSRTDRIFEAFQATIKPGETFTSVDLGNFAGTQGMEWSGTTMIHSFMRRLKNEGRIIEAAPRVSRRVLVPWMLVTEAASI